MIPDVLDDPDYASATRPLAARLSQRAGGSAAARRRRPIGAITVGPSGARPFPEARSRFCRPSPTRPSSPSRTCACSTSSSTQPRPHRGPRAADGDQRHPARHQPLANRRAAGVRHDRALRPEAVQRATRQRLHLRRQPDPPGGAPSTRTPSTSRPSAACSRVRQVATLPHGRAIAERARRARFRTSWTTPTIEIGVQSLAAGYRAACWRFR